MREKISLPQMGLLSSGLAKIINNQPRTIGAKATSFFKGNFKRQGFPVNGVLQKWEPRKQPDYRPGGALLKKSGRMARSIRTIEATPKRVAVGTSVPYAQIHNDGGRITGTANVPKHTRKAHGVKGHSRRQQGKTVTVPGHRRKSAQVEAHTRKMNLTFPKRQFIGHSPDLMKSIDRDYLRQVQDLERKIFG